MTDRDANRLGWTISDDCWLPGPSGLIYYMDLQTRQGHPRRVPQRDYVVSIHARVLARNRRQAYQAAVARCQQVVPSDTWLADHVHRV